MTLAGRKILLGVSGGIAAYKSCDLVRRLIDRGADVRVAMTEHATRFVSPLTFQALSNHPVRVEMFDPVEEEAIGHISLADWADAVVLAPATANLVGKLAHGIADDFLTTVILAATAPVLVCPAMNVQMYDNPLYRRNEQILRELTQYRVLDPAEGDLACGYQGKGRMPEVPVIADTLEAMLCSGGDLAGVRVLVTAGPTREAIDAVRFVSNRSSGKMGFAVARAAAVRGAAVTLIHGPVALDPPPGMAGVHPVTTAAEMADAVRAGIAAADALIMVAAVADYRPAETIAGKRKKSEGGWTLELERTEDILASLAGGARDCVCVGFAAESDDAEARAADKLQRKGLDLIVANDISRDDAGFGSDDNAAVILDAEGGREEIPLGPKIRLADRLLDRVAAVLKARGKVS